MNATEENGTIDWEKVDWDKSNLQIYDDLFRTEGEHTRNLRKYGIIGWARCQYGHPKIGNGKYSHIAWRTLDWSKSNNQIARELGVNISTIRMFRIKLGLDASTHRGARRSNQRIPEELIEGADWVNTSDTTLARTWGCSRERVRQIRQQLNAPQFSGLSLFRKELLESVQWVKEHRSELEGKKLIEITRIMPGNHAHGWKVRAIAAAGLSFQRGPQRVYTFTNQMDWRLSNRVLACIWDIKMTNFGSFRQHHDAPLPKWRLYGFRSYDALRNPDFIQAIEDQIKLSMEAGRLQDPKKVYDLLARMETEWTRRGNAISESKCYKGRVIAEIQRLIEVEQGLEVRSNDYIIGLQRALKVCKTV